MIRVDMLYTLSPVEFEEVVLDLVKEMGFDAETTMTTSDGGIDIIAQGHQPFTRGKYIIQCKRYSLDRRVGVKTARELYGVAVANKVNKAILISTSSFTKGCINFARENSIELIEGDKLVELLQEYNVEIPGVTQESDIADIIISQLDACIREEDKLTLSDNEEIAEYLEELTDYTFNVIPEEMSPIMKSPLEIDMKVIDKVYNIAISQYISTLIYKCSDDFYLSKIRKILIDVIRLCTMYAKVFTLTHLDEKCKEKIIDNISHSMEELTHSLEETTNLISLLKILKK